MYLDMLLHEEAFLSPILLVQSFVVNFWSQDVFVTCWFIDVQTYRTTFNFARRLDQKNGNQNLLINANRIYKGSEQSRMSFGVVVSF